MKKIYCLLSVRTSSKRLKNKCLLPFGEELVLDHVIKRCLYYKLKPIICTSIDKSDSGLNYFAKKYKIKIFRGSLNNKILRWFDCCKKFKIRSFHTIDVDDPFFDPLTVLSSMKLLDKGYDLIRASLRSRNGGASEGYSIKCSSLMNIIESNNLYSNKIDTEMIEKFLNINNLKTISLSNSIYETKLKFRLTLDYLEDYIFLKIIRSKFSFNTPRKIINNYLNKNTQLKKINYFRNSEWKKKQEQKINT